jgi:CheY-like chemotaxis protein
MSVLLVGPAERPEFAETRHLLTTRTQLVAAADPATAETLLARGRVVPEVIVVAQAYPGQFAPDAVDRLRGWAPLARIVNLLGSWCEGETRTGRPIPGAVRLYWHQARARLAQELVRLAQGRASGWALPATATDEERLLATADSPLPRGQGLIALRTRDTSMAQWLSDACRLAGYSTVRLSGPRWPQVAGATAGIFDATDLGLTETAELERMAAHLERPPIIALLDFPRVEDRDRALQHGATAVLAKPLVVEDLLWQLTQQPTDA